MQYTIIGVRCVLHVGGAINTQHNEQQKHSLNMYMFTLYSFVYTALARACTTVTPIRTHTHSLQLSPTILMDGCPPRSCTACLYPI